MAEREGFEPSLEFPLNTLSKRAPSTTRPSLQFGKLRTHETTVATKTQDITRWVVPITSAARRMHVALLLSPLRDQPKKSMCLTIR